mgnify:CR=1 FL=1
MIIFASLVLAGLILLILTRRREPDQGLLLLQREIEATRGDMNQQLQHLVNQVNQRLQEGMTLLQQAHSAMAERLDRTADVVGEVQMSLGRLSEATRRMEEIGRDISSFQQILHPPQARGGLGEILLEQLIRQILPDGTWETQYRFRNGETVDAVIRLAGRLVPVDAKFPLDNFRRLLEAPDEESKRLARKDFIRDVRGRINEIAQKYILPDEGTFDFALMYIPAENIYYEVIVNDEAPESLLSYALEKRVIPVSPNTFYAYLHTILLGLKGLRIEQNAREILAALSRLRGDLERFQDHFDVLGRHLTNAKNKYDEASSALERFRGKLDGIESQGDPLTLPEASPEEVG